MSNKMLIDASHPEETRVVVTRGDKVEEFDFESAHRKQLRGNIYLAKVTRVEPSLQAAFVDYGGNRHGFLAFSEIHPDYYQIPVADREALLADEAEDADEEFEQPAPEKKTRRRRGRRSKAETAEAAGPAEEAAAAEESSDKSSAESSDSAPEPDQEPVAEAAPAADDGAEPEAAANENTEAEAAPDEAPAADGASETDGAEDGDDPDKGPDRTISESAGLDDDVKTEDDGGSASISEETDTDSDSEDENAGSDLSASNVEAVEEDDSDDDEDGDDDEVESVGQEDALEEVPVRRARRRAKTYKIQEVIKRRQIILVQVVKEERGNKGAALTTYLSLAGRYSVLMPNTGRGGGISRKITNPGDRKRMREIVQDLSVPEGMGIILRTAGANRTKTEIKRDFEYLLRLWEQVRDLTLKSTAPTLVYEEGSLIKRSIRDLYNKEIGQILVAGDDGYREAKDFMRMLTPSYAKAVQPYKEDRPIFARYHVEGQLDAMFSPQVSLPSGGYLVINQTEALVAIDVNSGRATREHNIEDTALQTNLEAAQEVARQLRLRDLAGLVVIDFIDMEDKRNGRSVERKLKECLKLDRARIQVGRISHFGLLEMSRQRLRTGVLESSIETCASCGGTGFVRTPSSLALHILRSLEDHLLRGVTHDLTVKTYAHVALYILNQKRQHLIEIEQRFGLEISVESGEVPEGDFFTLEKGEPRKALESAPVITDFPEPPAEEASPAEDDEGGRKRRRRRRRRRGGGDENSETGDVAASGESEGDSAPAPDSDDEDVDGEPKKRRRRGRRGGRRSRRRGDGDAVTAEGENQPEAGDDDADEAAGGNADDSNVAVVPEEAVQETEAAETSAEATGEPEDTAEGSVSEPIEVAPEIIEEPVGQPEPNGMAAAEAAAEEAASEPDPDEEQRPKKRGWWQRRGFF